MDESQFTEKRRKLVREQLQARKIRDERVLAAMEKVPRHFFMPPASWADAYEDRAVPIGYDQTISQPYIVAFMTEILAIEPGQKILEIGSGCGYQTAILLEMGAQVFSVEIVPELAKAAAENLRRAGYSDLQIKTADGNVGWPEHAPYDSILVACAAQEIPKRLAAQLRERGRMVIPLGEVGSVQELCVFTRADGDLIREPVLPVQFVPMTGDLQRSSGEN